MSASMSSVASEMAQASSNMGMVAGATEEMTNIISEILKNTVTAKQIAEDVVKKTDSASLRINELEIAAGDIGHVVEVIADISDQVNLLALNATIEAARAGEAGKGFKPEIKRTHITIINQGVDYIADHLFEKLTVESIADHCCFSRHYYNRLFKSVTGESVYSFIKRIRLETAAFKLIKFPHLSVTHIAAEQGCSSSNFSSLFKKHYKISPSGFRATPRLPMVPAARAILDRIQTLQKSTPASLIEKNGVREPGCGD